MLAKFRLLTGHDCLAQHLNKIGIKESPIVSTESRNEWITSLNLSKHKLYKGYCGEILGCKKENDVIVNSSAFETNKQYLPKRNVSLSLY